MVQRFLSTALMLETTAVTTSTSRLAMKGSEKTLVANVMAANIEPTADPTPRYNIKSLNSTSPSDGKKMCTMVPARAQSRNITNSTMVKTRELAKGLRAALSVRRREGLLPRQICLLTE